MIKEAGRVHAVVTMVEDHLGGPIIRLTMKLEILVAIGEGIEVGGNMEGKEETMVGEMVIEAIRGLEGKVTVAMNQNGGKKVLLIWVKMHQIKVLGVVEVTGPHQVHQVASSPGVAVEAPSHLVKINLLPGTVQRTIIISCRVPVDYNRPPGEVNLVDWLKTMVSSRNSDGVVDPKMSKKPTSRALKKALLVALRCVDPDASKRPRMGHVIHMLEIEDFPYRDERRGSRAPGQSRLPDRLTVGTSHHETVNGEGKGTNAEPFRWRNPEA